MSTLPAPLCLVSPFWPPFRPGVRWGVLFGAGLLGLGVVPGCGDPEVVVDGTGGHSSDCSLAEAQVASAFGRWSEGTTPGEGGAAGAPASPEPGGFVPLAAGQDVTLQWGSQVGMGLPVTLELQGATLEQLDRVEFELRLEGSPLGVDNQEPPAGECRDGRLYLEAMVMVDVGLSPVVTSVAQLEGRTTELRFVGLEIDSKTGRQTEIASGAIDVVLHL